MRPIWDPSGQPAYQTHVKPGCTPHWIHGTHIGMFAGMYLHVHEPVRHYTYHSVTDSCKHIGSCATGTAHYPVPQNGQSSLNV